VGAIRLFEGRNSNQITNVFNAIAVGGDQVGTDGQNYMVADNTIDHFAGYGIDHSVTNIVIQGNQITNALDVCGSKYIHNDGIQGWNWEDKSGVANKNVVIDSNSIQSQTVTNLPLAVALQGIDVFDGFWGNISIMHNIALVSNNTGISIAGVNGLHIINNTVMDIPLNGVSQSQAYWMYSGMTWITAGGTTHEGGAASNVVVRNNIAPLIAATAAASGNCPIEQPNQPRPALTRPIRIWKTTNAAEVLLQCSSLALPLPDDAAILQLARNPAYARPWVQCCP
jgi:hypothetical protein